MKPFRWLTVFALILTGCGEDPTAPAAELRPDDPMFTLTGPVGQVSAGGYHSCALASDGSVQCWGYNGNGQASAPVGSFTSVSAGRYNTCAIDSDGSVHCWGDNGSGQSSAPTGSFTQVSTGWGHACAVGSDGIVQCWGENRYGQTNSPTGTFTEVSAGASYTCALASDGSVQCWGYDGSGHTNAPPGTFTQLSAGGNHTCALASDGTLQCWGYDGSGQANAPAGLFTQVSAGVAHTCALASDGSVQCWGDNSFGQTNAPVGTFTQVSAGEGHTCALAGDGTVDCWGYNDWGQTTLLEGAFLEASAGGSHICVLASDGSVQCWGSAAFDETNTPAGSFAQLSAGGSHVCALGSDGTTHCWGRNRYGQATVPVGSFTQVSAGGLHTCVMASDGSVKCWGDNRYGQTNSPSGPFMEVSAGGAHTCVLASDGGVQCWGDNRYGQTNSPSGTFADVSAGGSHTCALASDGSAHCWGYNGNGQTSVPAGSFTQMSAGGLHTCALASDSAVQCWGDNRYGQTSSPDGSFAQVSAGSLLTCATRSDGTAECWGRLMATTFFMPGANATPAGEHVAVNPTDATTGELSSTTITFSEVTGSGETSVSTSETGSPPPEGFRLGNPPVYYEINTTATFSGTIEVCIDYSGQTFPDEDKLTLLHDDGTGWVDVTSSHYPESDIICGMVSSLSPFVIAQENSAPVTTAGGPYAADEATPLSLDLSAADADGDPLTFTWDLGDGTTGTGSAPPTGHTYADDGVYTVSVTATDGFGGSHTATATATIANVAPTLGLITAPVDPQPVGAAITVNAAYSDPGTLDTHAATIDWNDGSATETVAVTGGVAEIGHTYSAAGVYRLRMTVSDDDGGISNEQVFEYVVVYDPEGAFVTGGGWIDSPPGAYAPDPTLSGKASFGFVSRYKPGATIPSGNTEFQFKAADFTFQSTSYEWLVVSGARAQYKGEGTINGGGTYKFLLTATDGQVTGGGGTDAFRIKITDLADNVIYDNVPGASEKVDEADPQAITRGSIVIHK